jgi:hypothetical protein
LRTRRAILAFAACASITGCALLQPPPPTAAAPLDPSTLLAGKTTKADVRAALGKAIVLDFDSGYEVWVYRERPPAKPPQDKPVPHTKELVLLFAPSGVLTKTRLNEKW